MKLKKFDKLIEQTKNDFFIRRATNADGGSKVYEIPGYDGTVAGYCGEYTAGIDPKIKKEFTLK